MEGKLLELSNEIDALKAAATAEKQQVSEKIAALDASIAALEEQLKNSGTSEDIQALINKVKETAADIKGIYVTPDETPEA